VDELSGGRKRERELADAAKGRRLTLDRDGRGILLFGGRSLATNKALNDLWWWRPDIGAWQLLDAGTGIAPPGRYSFGMAYDPANARLVVFGGASDDGDLADIWTIAP
jgi:galactose oxidase-like protein